MEPRYWDDDEINWRFVRRVSLGLVRDATEAERAVGIAYNLGGKAAVVRLLARWGEVEILKEDTSMAEAYRAACEERRRLHSLWAHGRKTATAGA